MGIVLYYLEMIDKEQYKAINPYSDSQAQEAFARLLHSPFIIVASRFLFPKENSFTLSKLLRGLNSIEDFQKQVMGRFVQTVINNSCSSFTYEGLNNLGEKPYLVFSNHRDIFLDPAFLEWILLENGKSSTEICIGSNLLGSNKLVDDFLRCNRMITVCRGQSARQLYSDSKILSSYIRESIVSGRNSVWIAQRQGRTKNGIDSTDQGLLKMLDMSGGKDNFVRNFEDLNIVPMSISYEYESCDIWKARELLISQSQKYVKARHEDTKSILHGIKQYKGRVHIYIGQKIDSSIYENAAGYDKNERYQILKHALDEKIISGYKLWNTNYIAYDLIHQTNKYCTFYSSQDVAAFKDYTEKRLDKVERSLNRNTLRQIFWNIYAGPVVNKELINK